MNTAFPRAAVVAAIIGCGLGALRAQAPETPSEVVKLPPLIVDERLHPLKWQYASLPGREVLSLCGAAPTEKFMQRDWQLEQWLRVLLPERFRARFSVAEGQILFTATTSRAHAPEIVAEMAKRQGAELQTDGTVVPADNETASFGELTRRRVQILPNLRLTDRDVIRVFSILIKDASEDFVFARDRIAFLLARRTPALPAWFSEGFAKLYQQTHFREDEFEFRQLPWTSPELTAALARDPEQPRILLSMEELFASPHVPKERDTADEKIWQAQAALFVRWALVEGNDTRRAQFWQWLDRLDEAPANEAAFRASFGFGYADARDRLSDYLREAAGRTARRPAQKIGRPPRIVLRAATDLEVARLRGDWERLQAQYVHARYPALAGQYSAQARRTLQRAYDRGERDPELLAIMGLLECDEDHAPAGRPYLEAALRQTSMRPRVGFELARLRLREFERGDTDHRFTEAETTAILDPLMRVVREAPALPEIYTLIEGVWLRSVTQPAKQDLAVLAEGVRNFPDATALVLGAVQLHVNAGAINEARALAERGRLFAWDASARAHFEQLCRTLAPAAP